MLLQQWRRPSHFVRRQKWSYKILFNTESVLVIVNLWTLWTCVQQCNLGINSNFLQNVHLYNLNERQPSLDYILLVFCRDAQGSFFFFGAGQGTLLPDVHFLEQLWQEQIYYCKMRRNCEWLSAPENFSAFYNRKFAPAKAAPKSAHINRGREQGDSISSCHWMI